MDQIIDIKNFQILDTGLKDKNMRQSIRLLSVFGCNGTEVLFVTKEDNVYAFGSNRFGCLGLSTYEDIPEPRLNATLSGKRLENIFYGFGHCIGLASDGQCYAWGDNQFGQLGIGSIVSTNTPTKISAFNNQRVIDISCGNSHTLALTADGQVYSWGRNTFGQLGDRAYKHRSIPFKIPFKFTIKMISCGKYHSLAVSSSGKVYVWGLNENGQLGRHKNEDIREKTELAVSNRPELIPNFKIMIKRAVCGQNHTLLLSTQGSIYAFGDNMKGQVGIGSVATQYTPTRIAENIKFKDIISVSDYDISLAVSIDGQYYVWGFCLNKTFLTPRPISKSLSDYSLYDIFAIYSKINKTYKTIIISEAIDENKTSIDRSVDPFSDNAINGFNGENVQQITRDSKQFERGMGSSRESDSSNDSTTPELSAKQLLQKQLNRSFNNPFNSDLKFIIEEKTPEMDAKYSLELLKLAIDYKEQELKDVCIKWIQSNIDLTNVCPLYELSENCNLDELKKCCIEYTKNNWKSMVRSDGLDPMKDLVFRRLLHFGIN